MTDHPILFSGLMVRALLEGHKTQTRRILTKLKGMGPLLDFEPVNQERTRWRFRDKNRRMHEVNSGALAYYLPYAVGDRLYVREAWRSLIDYDVLAPRDMQSTSPVFWEADRDNCDRHGRLRQGMHMPRWASRITLIVTDVRVQRAQEISEADAIAEGIQAVNKPILPQSWAVDFHSPWFGSPILAYATLWNGLNDNPPKRPYGWHQNPWVVATTFAVQRGNIDRMGAA